MPMCVYKCLRLKCVGSRNDDDDFSSEKCSNIFSLICDSVSRLTKNYCLRDGTNGRVGEEDKIKMKFVAKLRRRNWLLK